MDGFSNLSAMEIDPNGSIQDLLKEHGEDGAAGAEGGMGGLGGGVGGMMQDLAFSVSRPFSFLHTTLCARIYEKGRKSCEGQEEREWHLGQATTGWLKRRGVFRFPAWTKPCPLPKSSNKSNPSPTKQ